MEISSSKLSGEMFHLRCPVLPGKSYSEPHSEGSESPRWAVMGLGGARKTQNGTKVAQGRAQMGLSGKKKKRRDQPRDRHPIFRVPVPRIVLEPVGIKMGLAWAQMGLG